MAHIKSAVSLVVAAVFLPLLAHSQGGVLPDKNSSAGSPTSLPTPQQFPAWVYLKPSPWLKELYLPSNMSADVKARFESAWAENNPASLHPFLSVSPRAILWVEARHGSGRPFVAYEDDLSVRTSLGSLSGFFGSETAKSLDGGRIVDLSQTFDIMTAGARQCFLSTETDRQHPMHENCPTLMMAKSDSGQRFLLLPEYGGLALVDD